MYHLVRLSKNIINNNKKWLVKTVEYIWIKSIIIIIKIILQFNSFLGIRFMQNLITAWSIVHLSCPLGAMFMYWLSSFQLSVEFLRLFSKIYLLCLCQTPLLICYSPINFLNIAISKQNRLFPPNVLRLRVTMCFPKQNLWARRQNDFQKKSTLIVWLLSNFQC